jgi:hypothetical protein
MALANIALTLEWGDTLPHSNFSCDPACVVIARLFLKILKTQRDFSAKDMKQNYLNEKCHSMVPLLIYKSCTMQNQLPNIDRISSHQNNLTGSTVSLPRNLKEGHT